MRDDQRAELDAISTSIGIREVVQLTIRMWEWVVDKGGDNLLSGVSGARHGAMDALSRSLIAAGGPVSGRVVPVGLVEGASGFSYVRMAPVLTADCQKGVIRWS